MIVIYEAQLILEHQRNQRYFRSCTATTAHTKNPNNIQTHHVISAVEPCRRSRLCWPVDILLPLFGQPTNVSPAERWYSRISVLSILRSLAAMIVCSSTSASPQIHQRCHHNATTIGTLLLSIGTYHRTYHRSNDGIHKASSFFHRRFCCRSISGGSDDDCQCIYICTSPPIED